MEDRRAILNQLKNLKKYVLFAIAIPLIPSACTERKEIELTQNRGEPDAETVVTIVYDNNPHDVRLTTAWGFSCLIKLSQKVILFDTGGDGSILLSNMAKLGINPQSIDVVVLSHIHGDHVGGLAKFLEQNNQVTAYMPASFPNQMKQEVKLKGAKVEEVHKAKELFEGVFTTGDLNGGIKEQSLLIRTSKGLMIITGCAHPGVVNIVERAKEIARDKVYLLMGGFHLLRTSPSQINYIAQSLHQLGVEKVAPCHCSGEEARRLFKDYFSENYIESGVGKQIAIQ
ncbi:MAG: MBL fold metallo-hydrolase [Chloroflexi bacterium CG23_combo_of_CG06-09_8_20_14_all_45_10]|nr:MAG: MBL fold metallo-hydrolase [Chloroflexi bacterium CG23_combo_of_CG06-09_8_20_14_all_45_10]